MIRMLPLRSAEVLDFLAWLGKNHPKTRVRNLSDDEYTALVRSYLGPDRDGLFFVLRDWANSRADVEMAEWRKRPNLSYAPKYLARMLRKRTE